MGVVDISSYFRFRWKCRQQTLRHQDSARSRSLPRTPNPRSAPPQNHRRGPPEPKHSSSEAALR
ncbi:hypothetical protein BD289DRAFT_428523 [Coniella lustricola]|uniref:Uncharacterized protein n=1 Tax=Coniella lustricola TaxID=2025994 RepID=A0A2T3AE24_9PEZI|nr:hypothetical protein BD289DRAFT_428523 [Coniella lustricola]